MYALGVDNAGKPIAIGGNCVSIGSTTLIGSELMSGAIPSCGNSEIAGPNC